MVTATAITNTLNLNHGRQNGLANAQCAWPSLVERGGAERREKALGAFALPCALWLGAADHLGQATTTIAHATAMAGSRAHTARRPPRAGPRRGLLPWLPCPVVRAFRILAAPRSVLGTRAGAGRELEKRHVVRLLGPVEEPLGSVLVRGGAVRRGRENSVCENTSY